MQPHAAIQQWLARFGALLCVAMMFAVYAWGWKIQHRKDRLREWTNPTIERYRAIERAVQRGRLAVPELIVQLESSDPLERADAMLALGRIGADGEAAIPRLLALLGDPRPETRQSAASTLADVGRRRAAVWDRLVAALSDSDEGVRASIVNALVRLGPPVANRVSRLLDSQDHEQQRAAAAILERLSRRNRLPLNGEALSRIRVALADDADPDLRRSAFIILSRTLELRLENVIDELARDDAQTFWQALMQLRRFTHRREEVLDVLEGLLVDRRAEVRAATADLAGEMGAAAAPLAPALTVALRDGQSRFVRQRAAEALGRIGVATPAVMDGLQNLLDDEAFYSRLHAARAIASLDGRAAKALVPPARTGLRSESSREKLLSLAVLLGFERLPPAVAPDLVAALDDPDERVRNLAARALSAMGQAARSAVPHLVRVLEHRQNRMPDPEDQGPTGPPTTLWAINGAADTRYNRDTEAVIEALSNIGVRSKAVCDRLTAALFDEAPNVRWAAVGALTGLYADAPELPGRLCGLLVDDHPYVRARAAWALPRTRYAPSKAVPLLVEALDDANPYVRSMAVCSLGELGPDSRPAVPRLRALRALPESRHENHELVELEGSFIFESVYGSGGSFPEFLRELRQLSVAQLVDAALERIEPRSLDDQ